MNRIKNLVFLLLGIVIGIVASRNQAFINILKKVNWSVLTFWFSLFIGATIPITINYFSMKKQEVIKLKAKFAQDKIDIIRDYQSFDFLMRSTVILDKKVSDLEFNYEPTPQDLSAPTIRGLGILESHEIYSNWKLNYMMHVERLNLLGSKEISNYTWYVSHYILNLEILIENIPDYKMWNVAVAVKNDFIDMSIEFREIINEYLNHTLYKFKNDYNKKDKGSKENVKEKLNKTNLIKYKEQLLNLKDFSKI